MTSSHPSGGSSPKQVFEDREPSESAAAAAAATLLTPSSAAPCWSITLSKEGGSSGISTSTPTSSSSDVHFFLCSVIVPLVFLVFGGFLFFLVYRQQKQIDHICSQRRLRMTPLTSSSPLTHLTATPPPPFPSPPLPPSPAAQWPNYTQGPAALDHDDDPMDYNIYDDDDDEDGHYHGLHFNTPVSTTPDTTTTSPELSPVSMRSNSFMLLTSEDTPAAEGHPFLKFQSPEEEEDQEEEEEEERFLGGPLCSSPIQRRPDDSDDRNSSATSSLEWDHFLPPEPVHFRPRRPTPEVRPGGQPQSWPSPSRFLTVTLWPKLKGKEYWV